MTTTRVPEIPEGAVAVVRSPVGVAYRGKLGCRNLTCTSRGEPDRCFGWHCAFCHEPSDAQGGCSACERGRLV